MPNNIRATVGVKDNASSELDRIKAKFAGLQKQGAKGIGIGIAAGATTAAVGILGDAVGRMGDLIGDATQAAMEEEVSIKKLGAALQANIKDWNGNTDAIEQTLQSRMRLGFADDEQRESLATLVAVTKDSTKALDLQRKAMDLARLRNISLQAAADILGKVYGGNIGILSRYGIQVKKGATATEAPQHSGRFRRRPVLLPGEHVHQQRPGARGIVDRGHHGHGAVGDLAPKFRAPQPDGVRQSQRLHRLVNVGHAALLSSHASISNGALG